MAANDSTPDAARAVEQVATPKVQEPPPAQAPASDKAGQEKGESQSTALTGKDLITITISVLALLISATSSYFTLFRVHTTVGCAVLDVAFDSDKKTTTATVAVSNTGNQHVALTGAELYLVQMNKSEALRQQLIETKASAEKATFPVLIEPGKLFVFKIQADLPWESVVEYRQDVEAGDDHSHKTIMGVRMKALSAAGIHLTGNNDAIKIELRDKSFGGYAVDSEFKTLKPTPSMR